ncbi:MAG: bifunctional DNA-binding transcriptional regulator/O6-methylguanine-DNA methyltransferase Ada, partial [Methylocella sp.]
MFDNSNVVEVPADHDPRWQAVVARDRNFDGHFYYAVKTTGVYCRPSCAARVAKPENVSFHATREDAEQAGFRPCRRCEPDKPALVERHAAKVAAICRGIEAAEVIPSLSELARKSGLSTYHFHRLFKAVTGVTPRAYAIAHRAKRIRDALAQPGTTVTAAIYDAGFNSSGRFYESSNTVLGMTPTDYRAGGANTGIRFAIGECSLGSILVARSERGVCAILMGDDPDALARKLQDRFPHARLLGGDAGFEELVAKVVGFVEAPSLGLDLPLDLRGTAFQQRVWQALQKIAAGSTASYAD